MKMLFRRRMSTFGGPHGFGVRPAERLALVDGHNRQDVPDRCSHVRSCPQTRFAEVGRICTDKFAFRM